jgi:hypothetical protein
MLVDFFEGKARGPLDLQPTGINRVKNSVPLILGEQNLFATHPELTGQKIKLSNVFSCDGVFLFSA